MKRINFVDNKDSFAYTIAEYFKIAGANVKIFSSDRSLDILVSGNPDLILLGPGPNGPRQAGNYMELLDKYHSEFPFFGICLGFQAMMEYFGQPVVRLNNVMHGKRVAVKNDGSGVFEGIEQNAKFARYNSLGVYDVPKNFESTATYKNIIMAARHKALPIEGIQFHPESALSMANDNGLRLIRNVLKYLPEKVG